jgi:hypothetical protein
MVREGGEDGCGGSARYERARTVATPTATMAVVALAVAVAVAAAIAMAAAATIAAATTHPHHQCTHAALVLAGSARMLHSSS